MTIRLTTYTLPRPFHGYNVPIAMQSSFMRAYASRSNYQFSLPVTELTTSNSYLMLRSLIRGVGNEPLNLAVCSGFVFPIDDLALLNAIFFGEDVADELLIHLVLEAQVVDRDGLIGWAQGLGRLGNFTRSYSEQPLIPV